MTNVNDMFPSDYIKASDLKGQEFTMTMSHVEQREMGDGKVKPVLFFAGAQKGLVLNRTNAMTIASYYGPEVEGWQGESLVLYTAKVPFGNQMTDAVRVRAPAKPAQQRQVGGMGSKAQTVKAMQEYDEANPPPVDDIPF